MSERPVRKIPSGAQDAASASGEQIRQNTTPHRKPIIGRLISIDGSAAQPRRKSQACGSNRLGKDGPVMKTELPSKHCSPYVIRLPEASSAEGRRIAIAYLRDPEQMGSLFLRGVRCAKPDGEGPGQRSDSIAGYQVRRS